MTDYIDQIVSALNKLYGLPAVALVAFSCIVVGYIIRYVRSIDNSAIPVVVILWGALAMSLVADSRANNMSLRVWVVRNILVGLAIGFISWMAHRYVIKRFEDWVTAKFPQSGGTQFFAKLDKPTDPDTDTKP